MNYAVTRGNTGEYKEMHKSGICRGNAEECREWFPFNGVYQEKGCPCVPGKGLFLSAHFGSLSSLSFLVVSVDDRQIPPLEAVRIWGIWLGWVECGFDASNRFTCSLSVSFQLPIGGLFWL